MLNALKKRVKNEKGLTLIELLAVVVILGIIAAIAIPSIGGLIDNSKKDAHIANATQMINSAKTHVASNPNLPFASNTETVTLQTMIDQGLIDDMEDPDSGTKAYEKANSLVTITKTTASGKAASYSYKVTLVGSERKIADVALDSLGRASVVAK